MSTPSTQEATRQTVGAASAARTRLAGLKTTAKEWAEMIKIEHTVFALPFALSGLVLAGPLPAARVVLWTVLAFAGARAAAMTLNRIIDSELDLLNPRTSGRAIPQGRIRKADAFVFAICSFALMIFAASKLPPLCIRLSPVAILWLSFYSFTKRFSWLCHLALGIALGGAALGGWVASSGEIAGMAPWVLALSVATWVAGFDIMYACQDLDFDRKEHLHSMPAAFGVAASLQVARALHVVTLAALIWLGLLVKLGPIFFFGLLLVGALLVWEHSLVKPYDLSKVNAAFFNVNGIVSILAFLAILLDRIFCRGAS